jgi:hypothetical protein
MSRSLPQIQKKALKTMKTLRKNWATLASLLGGIAAVIIATVTTLADVPQPVLTIAPLGTNHFNVGIANGVATTNYTLFWTPALGNENYPWQVLGVGATGETNFTVDANVWSVGFFRVTIGADADGDGIPDWQDGQPFNPGVGNLSITIDSPVTGTVFN